MAASDQMDQVDEGLVHWTDVILLATPIRWSAAGSSPAEGQGRRLHRYRRPGQRAGRCGPALGFFGEIGCQFPQFPYVAHLRGWSAEDLERNQVAVQQSTLLHDGAAALARRSVEMARMMIASSLGQHALVRGGRKAHRLEDAAP